MDDYEGLLTVPQSFSLVADQAVAKAMMFASGVTSRSGYLDCMSMNDLPMNSFGNMRHLIVEAVKANFYNQSKVPVVTVTSKRSTIVVSSLEDEDKDGSFKSKRGYSKCKSRYKNPSRVNRQ